MAHACSHSTETFTCAPSLFTFAAGELPEVSREEMYVHTARSRKVMVEVVGEAKIQARQSQIHLLTSARVVGAAVSHIVSAKGGV